MGQSPTVDEIATDCDPIVKNSDLKPYITKNFDGSPLQDDAPANPCGLIAKSLSTDKFSIFKGETAQPDEKPVTPDFSNIAWKSDVAYKFKNSGEGDAWKSIQWADKSD